MKKMDLAVIGLGYWGPNLVRNLLSIPQVSQVYGCDLLKKNTDSVKKNYPNVYVTNSYSEILENGDINAVLIATPVTTHFELAKTAILAGKNVFVEKPMTSTSKQAEELIEIARKRRKILMVGHTFIYSEAVRKIKKLIDSGELGRIYYYDSTRINLGLIQKDNDVVNDLAPHDLSIITYLFPGNPVSLQAFGSSFIGKQNEFANIFIKFENNITAHIQVSWLSPVKIRSVIIGGSKKMIVWNDIEPSEKIKIYDKGVIPSKSSVTPFAPAYRSGDVVIPKLEQKEALFTEMSEFVDCVLKNKQPVTNGKEGLKVVSLLEATEKAILSHKEVIL